LLPKARRTTGLAIQRARTAPWRLVAEILLRLAQRPLPRIVPDPAGDLLGTPVVAQNHDDHSGNGDDHHDPRDDHPDLSAGSAHGGTRRQELHDIYTHLICAAETPAFRREEEAALPLSAVVCS
jgi:hypothetical protein